ncbi:MFS transporter [Rhodobacterales bacterium HKCCE2091]|nr:MFS transporter [Rhodobacterales bacterium HKCCE2091]
MSDTAAPSRARRNVAVLVAAQAILGAQMPILFVIGGLAGQMIAPSPLLATMAISLIVFGSMTTAPWLSALMQRHGRRAGFVLGTAAGAAGAATAGYGLWIASFPLFLVGSYLSGIYMSAQGFYRFAAADTATAEFRARAISYVMAGGLVSALIGPQLVRATSEAMVVPFVGSYVAAAALNLVGVFLFAFLDLPKPREPAEGEARGRTRRELLRDPRIAVAIICAAVSYALMNLMMTSTPLAVVGCGFGGELLPDRDLSGMSRDSLRDLFVGHSSNVVSAHVIAMFAPSFITGTLINRFGVTRIMGLGLALLALAGVVALSGVELTQFFIALVFLGFGWNFGFIGATTLLASSHADSERGRVQGMNDFIVFGCVTVASLASGALMNSGDSVVAGWHAVNLAMIPFLTLAGGALIWLMLKPEAEPDVTADRPPPAFRG